MLINTPHTFFSVVKDRKVLQILIVLVITNWIAHFWNYQEFGLYEDDWYRIAPAIDMTFPQLGNYIIFNFLNLADSQGRPLHPILISCLSSLAYKLGGISIAYWFGAIILTINAFLFYVLLRCLFQIQGFAILGALACCLFPADTTQLFLTHSLGVQPSLTILLVAMHLYIAQKEYMAYGTIFLCLMCYEPIFPVFAIAPFLQQKNNNSIKKVLRHIFLMGMMVVVTVIMRRIFGEGNITNPNPYAALLLFTNPISGPLTAIAMFFARPVTALIDLPKEYWGLLLPYFGGLAWFLHRYKLSDEAVSRPSGNGEQEGEEFLEKYWLLRKIPENFRNLMGDLVRPMAIGLAMLVLAYPLTLTTIGISVSGRGTRVHAAAVFGASILFASIALMIFRLGNRYGKKRLIVAGMAAYLTLLLGFGLTVQLDYKMSWQHQRAFWTEAIALIPDITNETVIFLEPTGLRDTRNLLFLRKELTGIPDTRQIKSLDFMYLMLPIIYKLPPQWKYPPRIYRLPKQWQTKILSPENLLQTASIEEDWSGLIEGVPRRSVKSSNVIFLETSNGKLTRRTEPLSVGGKIFKLKEQSATGLPPFTKTSIYNYLIRQPNEPPISYLLQ